MKAGPRQTQFEPSEGKTVKFSDVHGVDEAKEVGTIFTGLFILNETHFPGTSGYCCLLEGSCGVFVVGW